MTVLWWLWDRIIGPLRAPPSIFLTGNVQRNIDPEGASQRNAVVYGNSQRNVSLTQDAGADS